MLIGRLKRDYKNYSSWTWQFGEQFLPQSIYSTPSSPPSQWVPRPRILVSAWVLDPIPPGNRGTTELTSRCGQGWCTKHKRSSPPKLHLHHFLPLPLLPLLLSLEISRVAKWVHKPEMHCFSWWATPSGTSKNRLRSHPENSATGSYYLC